MREYSASVSDSPTRSPTRSPEFPYDVPPSSPRRFDQSYNMLPPHSPTELRTLPVSMSTQQGIYYLPSPTSQQEPAPLWAGQYPSYQTHAESSLSYPYTSQANPSAFHPSAAHERNSWSRRTSGVARVEEYQRANLEGHAFEGQVSDMAWGVEGSQQGQPLTPSVPSSTSPRLPTMRRQDHTRTRSVPSTWSAEQHNSVQAHSPPMYHTESPTRGEYAPGSGRAHPYENPSGGGHRS